MKKVLFNLVAILGMAIMFTSCEKTDFKFQFAVDGFVNDTEATGITSEFQANVGNETVFEFANSADSVYTLDAPEAEKASQWVDDYTHEFLKNNFSNSCKYSVHIKGYVTESYTGMIFAVDRVITNDDSTKVLLDQKFGTTQINYTDSLLDSVQ